MGTRGEGLMAAAVMRLCGILALVFPMLAALDAQAAVRVCHDTVLSEIVVHQSEMAAKKAALDQWRAKARGLGVGYDGWHVAAGKALKCFAKDGSFECVALGRPCVIQQNPNQRPAGADRRGQPL